MVPILEYVLEPTYSAQWKRREGKVKCIIYRDRQETQLAILGTARRGFIAKGTIEYEDNKNY